MKKILKSARGGIEIRVKIFSFLLKNTVSHFDNNSLQERKLAEITEIYWRKLTKIDILYQVRGACRGYHATGKIRLKLQFPQTSVKCIFC